jgi:AcrR family transcriptional regulator
MYASDYLHSLMLMTKPSGKVVKEARERILDAGLKLFAEKGYDGATTRDIASDAGVNEVTIFRIFGSKEVLFESIMTERFPFNSIKQKLDFGSDGPLDAVFFRNAKMVVELLKQNHHLFMMLVGEIWRHPEMRDRTTEIIIGTAIDYLSDIFSGLMDEGRLKRTDPKILARAWMGMMQSHFLINYILSSAPPSETEENKVIRGFVDVFLNGARGEKE